MNIADVPVALLAGGLATRLRPLTETVPKALVEVGGRPFIDHQLALLHRNGIRHVVLCVGHLGEQIEAHVGNGRAYDLDVVYSYDGEVLLGTGGALRRAAPFLGSLCWVVYGDSYLDIDYAAILSHFTTRAPDKLGLMTILQNDNQWDRSNVVFQQGRLLCYDKHVQTPDMTYIDYGAALVRQGAWERIVPGQRADLADLYHALVAEGQMDGYVVTQRFYEIGAFSGLEETRTYLSEETP